MAIDKGTETATITTEERTWRVNIETPKNGDPVVTVWREDVRLEGAEVVSKEPVGSATRQLSAIAATTATVPGTEISLTMAQIAALIAHVADVWRTEDLA